MKWKDHPLSAEKAPKPATEEPPLPQPLPAPPETLMHRLHAALTERARKAHEARDLEEAIKHLQEVRRIREALVEWDKIAPMVVGPR